MKAQGSLEYLIIIAAILAVAAIVVLFLTGVFGAGKTGANIAGCKEAAARCATEWVTSLSPTCDYCYEACSAFPTKVQFCLDGLPDHIHY